MRLVMRVIFSVAILLVFSSFAQAQCRSGQCSSAPSLVRFQGQQQQQQAQPQKKQELREKEELGEEEFTAAKCRGGNCKLSLAGVTVRNGGGTPQSGCGAGNSGRVVSSGGCNSGGCASGGCGGGGGGRKLRRR